MATDTQICIKCHVEKSIDQYNVRDKKSGKRHTTCKVCHSAYLRQHYLANKEKYIKKARKWDAENKAEHLDKARRYVLDYLLKHPCVDCGETDPIVLQFDHVRGDKFESVSVITASVISLKRLKAEISKCEVRCANCHRIKTANEEGWRLLDLLREYSQTNYLNRQDQQEV